MRLFAMPAILTQRRPLAIALLLSLLIHAAAYVVSPRWDDSFTPTRPAQYDATLQTLVAQPVNIAKAEPPANRPAPRVVPQPKRAPQLAPIRRDPSDAGFAAPEGAIAVAVAEATGETSAEAAAVERTIENNQAAAKAETATAPTAEAVSIPSSSAPETQSAAVVPKRALPAFAERMVIEYKLTSSITDGVASFRWSRNGDQYEIESSTQATGFLVSAFAGTIHQRSAGQITDQGLRPSRFSIRRGEGEAETAEFAHDTKALILTRKRESRTVPLARELQDMQSFLFQLAHEAPRLPESAEKLDVLVTNARKVYRHQFRKMGIETIETRFGAVETVRWLSEAANPEDAYEVWLAPEYQSLPVKLKMYLGKFPVEQVATRISVSAR